MSTQVERAVQLYNEARFAEEQGNIDRVEVLYLESQELFMQEGGMCFTDAADIMNAIASMKEKQGDYDGALRAAEKSVQMLDDQFGGRMDRRAAEIRLQAWIIIGNMHCYLARYTQAEHVFRHALEYALNFFGEEDHQTISIRDRLGMLYKNAGELEKSERL